MATIYILPENAILAQSHNDTLHILVTLICFFKGKKMNSGLQVTARSNFILFEKIKKSEFSFSGQKLKQKQLSLG
jgi:hypothetical protein